MYKAVIFDLDGTAIPNKRDGMPSKRVIEVVNKVKDKVYVCAATGRGISLAGDIIKSLGLTSPCIVGGGTQVIDPVTRKVLWEKDMDKNQIEKIMEIAKEYQYPVFFGDETEGALLKYKITQREERIIYIEPVTKEDTEIILEKLSKIPNITAHKVISWTSGHFDIHITHIEATKRHSMEVLLKILKVHKDEVVAVGDSNNDLPLFELAGYKIAMENGSDELKKKADMIAPSVSEDGLAVALEKLFLAN
ncbi:MAG: HAD family phosphatase [Candidatus Staskawiczbacteria bacterium]|nr:HAD family phosphatase [Candidatus Staskawiczbacteria bacterium]